MMHGRSPVLAAEPMTRLAGRLRMGERGCVTLPVIRAETEIVREIAPVDGYVRISLIARRGATVAVDMPGWRVEEEEDCHSVRWAAPP